MFGQTYLTKPDSHENVYCAHVVRAITKMDESRKLDPKYIRFVVKLDDPNKTEEIIAYNDLVDFVLQEIERDSEGEQYYRFKCICAHQGPYTKEDPEYNGSTWNVQIEWEDGSCTFEPLSVIASDDPVSCALYAKKNELRNTPGWKCFKQITKHEKVLVCMLW